MKKKYKYGAILLVCFMLGVGLVIPIFTRKEELESDFIEPFIGTNESSTYTGSDLLGYEILDSGTVFHMWNQYNDYFFNRSSGIQFTNHYQEYWTKNVLLLGYYTGGQWNLLHRNDELSGFTEILDYVAGDYINVTLWKDVSVGSYSCRLALRYHLKVNDPDLTIIPYIKSLGDAIPYELGFGWEMKDIKINNNVENDQVRINGTSYLLNQTLDIKYTNITRTFYEYNETTNTTTNYTVKIGEVYLENINTVTGKANRDLYLKWNPELDYLVTVKSRSGQYNAPVTLFIKVGMLDVGQEKSTELYWHDATLVDSYSETNKTSGVALQRLHPSTVSGRRSALTQSFTGGAYKITSAKFYMKKTGSATGMAHAVLYAHSGTYGTSSVPTGAALATSGDFDVSTLTGDYVLYTLSFTGGEQYEMQAGTKYCIVFENPTSGTISDAIHPDVGYDYSSSSHDGNMALFSGGAWEIFNLYDVCFYVYGEEIVANAAPTVDFKFPVNASKGISLTPKCKAYCNDTDAGDTLTVTWATNETGSWINMHTNTSVAVNTIPAYTFTGFDAGGITYWWKVFVYDGTVNVSEIYHFTTKREWQDLEGIESYLKFVTKVTTKKFNQLDSAYLTFVTKVTTKKWNQLDSTYLTFVTVSRSWNQLDKSFLSFDVTSKTWNSIDKGYFTFTTPSISFNQLDKGYLSFITKTTTKKFNQLDSSYLTFITTSRSWNQIDKSWLSFAITSRAWNKLDSGYLTFTTPSKSWEQIDDGWLSFVTKTTTKKWNQLDSSYLTFTTSSRSWEQIDKGWLSFNTVGRGWNSIDTGYLNFNTVGKSWEQLDIGYLNFVTKTTTKKWNQLDSAYLTFTTDGRSQNQISKGWLSFVISSRSWNSIDNGYLTFDTAGSSWNQIDKGYLTFTTKASTKKWNQLDSAYLVFNTKPSTKAWNQIDTGYLVFTTSGRRHNQIDTGFLTFDTSDRVHNQIDVGWLTFPTKTKSWEQSDVGYLTFTTATRSWNQVSEGWLSFGMTGSTWNQQNLGYLTFTTVNVWDQADTGWLSFETPAKGDVGGGTEDPESVKPPFIRTTIETLISPQAILLWSAIFVVVFLLVYSRREKQKHKRDIIVRRVRKVPSKADVKQISDKVKSLDNRMNEIAKSFKRK